MRPLLLALVLGVSLAGCVDRSHGGYFDDHAFYSVRQHYRVRYAPEVQSQRGLMPRAWRFTRGVELHGGLPQRLRPEPDGRSPLTLDGRRVWTDRVDLRFEHRETGGAVVIRTTPLPRALEGRNLDVLVHEIVEVAARPAETRSGAVQVVRTIEEGPTTVGGAPAYQAVFEGAALSPYGDVIATSTDRALLVLVRPSGVWYSDPNGRSGTRHPMIVALWLVARQEHFDALLPDFRSLLDRTDFH